MMPPEEQRTFFHDLETELARERRTRETDRRHRHTRWLGWVWIGAGVLAAAALAVNVAADGGWGPIVFDAALVAFDTTMAAVVFHLAAKARR